MKKLLYRKLSISASAILCNKFSIMFSSGISISRVFENMEIQTKNTYIKSILGDLKYDIMNGKSLYHSMKKFNGIFPEYMIETIGIGEESGKLDKVLEELSKYYEQESKVYSNLKSALIYPAITFVTAVLVVIFLMNSIMPGFIDLIKLSNAKIPPVTEFVIDIFKFWKRYFMEILGFNSIIIILVYKYFKSSKGTRLMENIKINIPYFGKIYNEIILLKMASSMSILNFAGINILKSLYITGKTLGNSVFRNKINNSIERVKDGENISNAFSNEKIGNELFISMVEIGEETGQLDLMFEKLKNIYIHNVNMSINRVVKIIEPLIIIFLSIFIGIFVVAAIMPIFSIMDSIS